MKNTKDNPQGTPCRFSEQIFGRIPNVLCGRIYRDKLVMKSSNDFLRNFVRIFGWVARMNPCSNSRRHLKVNNAILLFFLYKKRILRYIPKRLLLVKFWEDFCSEIFDKIIEKTKEIQKEQFFLAWKSTEIIFRMPLFHGISWEDPFPIIIDRGIHIPLGLALAIYGHFFVHSPSTLTGLGMCSIHPAYNQHIIT